ncbi:hypothetical protein [Pseudomonas sp. LFS044]|uniref:hypothetical protein n=1 Tax=Pseudomonas sp. LFS044 TaxID=3229880 RepID=UPI003A7FE521
MKYFVALLTSLMLANLSWAEDGAQRSKEFNQYVKETNKAATEARERARLKAEQLEVNEASEVNRLIEDSRGDSKS